jgi:hypothetical protein
MIENTYFLRNVKLFTKYINTEYQIIECNGQHFHQYQRSERLQWLVAGRWFSPSTPVFSTNKTDRHDITEILLKVALNTITTTPHPSLQTIKHNKVKLRHPGPRLRQARKCGRVKSVNGITILPS